MTIGKREEIPQEIIDQMTPPNVHMIYCLYNWDSILLGGDTPCITAEQLDDLWSGYFGVFATDGNGMMIPADELTSNGHAKDETDFNNRLVSFNLMLGNLATKVLPFENFMTIVGSNDIVEFGIDIALKSMEKTFAAQSVVAFREKLIDKLFKNK